MCVEVGVGVVPSVRWCAVVCLYLWQRVSVRNRSLSQCISVAPLWRGQGSLFPLAVLFANFSPASAHATVFLPASFRPFPGEGKLL